MNKILLVEDDKSLGPTLKTTLENNSFEVKLCENLSTARAEDLSQYHLLLLDWMLPDGQGIDFLREVENKIPVIMLTARADLIDKVLGLESGANDYITKPFEARELIARIRVQLRQPLHPSSEESINIVERSGLHLNLNERIAKYNNEELILTKMEFDLLYILSTNPNQVFSREKLLDKVWGYENYPTTRTVDTHVLQIRQKIHNEIILTVRGVGYRFTNKDDN